METMHFKQGTARATLHLNQVSAAGVWMVARETATCSKRRFGDESFFTPSHLAASLPAPIKDYPVDYSHMNIMGYALGAKGVEPDPDQGHLSQCQYGNLIWCYQ